MASLNKITTIIAGHLDREFDEPFKKELAVSVDLWRATLISRSLEKHPQQRKFFQQTIWLPMEVVDPTSCPVPIPLCKIARSKYPLPANPLRFGNEWLDYVGTIDGLRGFQYSDPGTIRFMTAGKYSGNIIFYERMNNYIEVRQNRVLPMIRVDGVWDNPIEVMKFNCKVAGVGCDWWDEEYPCTNDINQMIIQYILQVDYQRVDVPEEDEIEVNPLLPKNKREA